MNKTVKQLATSFLQFETENNLFEFKPGGVPIWELIRFKVFENLKSNFFEKGPEISDNNFSTILGGFGEYIKNAYKKNPLNFKGQVDTLILNHPRRKFNGQVYEEIYIDDLLKHLDEDYLVLERYNNLDHYKPTNTKNLYYLDYIEFPSRIIAYTPFTRGMPKTDRDKIKEIDRLLCQKFDVTSTNIIRESAMMFSRYNYLYKKIDVLLNLLAPRKIIILVSYQLINQIITKIAKGKGIPVIEFQHGVVGEYHIAYNYEIRKDELETFPDYFFSWGKYWTENSKLPIPKKNVIDVGFQYLGRSTKNEIVREDKTILVLSQKRKDIAKMARDLAKNLPNHLILFKAHPSEYHVAKEEYHFLSDMTNLRIINDDSERLYNLFKKSNYVIGVSSTALIEAIVFCPNIIIAKYYGWEYYENLEGKNFIKFFGSSEKICEYILNKRSQCYENDSNYFFKDNSISEIIRRLDRI